MTNAMAGFILWTPLLDGNTGMYLLFGLLFFGVSTIIGIAALVLVIVVEGVALRILEWAPFWKCMADSLLMNLASTIFGMVLGMAAWTGGVDIFEFRTATIILWLLSVVLGLPVEFAVLYQRSERADKREVAIFVAIANGVGYAILLPTLAFGHIMLGKIW